LAIRLEKNKNKRERLHYPDQIPKEFDERNDRSCNRVE
jgi:hypothetical protein